MAATHDLTVYETFLPDLVGHGRVAVSVEDVVHRLDGLLGGILAAATAQVTLLLTSDHGNFESRSEPGHTRNPVPWLAAGPAADHFRNIRSLTGVTPRVLDVLSGRD
jgi:bisphosphoglycerate-independent phosphoglycerate mutase (AlkP superfamily)